jgi:hypothetical protein
MLTARECTRKQLGQPRWQKSKWRADCHYPRSRLRATRRAGFGWRTKIWHQLMNANSKRIARVLAIALETHNLAVLRRRDRCRVVFRLIGDKAPPDNGRPKDEAVVATRLASTQVCRVQHGRRACKRCTDHIVRCIIHTVACTADLMQPRGTGHALPTERARHEFRLVWICV